MTRGSARVRLLVGTRLARASLASPPLARPERRRFYQHALHDRERKDVAPWLSRPLSRLLRAEVIDRSRCPSSFFQKRDDVSSSLFLELLVVWRDALTRPRSSALRCRECGEVGRRRTPGSRRSPDGWLPHRPSSPRLSARRRKPSPRTRPRFPGLFRQAMERRAAVAHAPSTRGRTSSARLLHDRDGGRGPGEGPARRVCSRPCPGDAARRSTSTTSRSVRPAAGASPSGR